MEDMDFSLKRKTESVMDNESDDNDSNELAR